MQNAVKANNGLTILEITIFSMFGSLMFLSKIIMQALPNIHLLGMLVVMLTVVYRKKALIPIYIYVMLEGIFGSFATWWIPYLYIWTILWGVTMLIPKNISNKKAKIVYPIICSLHGFLFGTLYAPVQAIIFGLDFNQMLLWIAAGFWFDCIHGVSNFVVGFLIEPLSKLVKKLDKSVD